MGQKALAILDGQGASDFWWFLGPETRCCTLHVARTVSSIFQQIQKLLDDFWNMDSKDEKLSSFKDSETVLVMYKNQQVVPIILFEIAFRVKISFKK